MASRVAVRVAAIGLMVAMFHPVLDAAVDVPKLTVRLTPLVRMTRGDANGLVTVPQHVDNRVLRVILESEDYYRLSDVQLDGGDAPLSHSFYWRDLPPGSYRITVQLYGPDGLRGSTSMGSTTLMSGER
jgi:hypothetical protein